ncbi:MAG: ATP-binding protein [Brevinematales bacterium]|nr:ATP-binding protein [Brevinematales bacterium]
MLRHDIFSIPLSRVLQNMGYWITTSSRFMTTFCNTRNRLVFSGSVIFEVSMTDSSIDMDLVKSKQFSFALVSKEKIFVGNSDSRIILIPNFEKLVLIENLKLSEKVIKKLSILKENIKPQDLISKISEMFRAEKVTVISKRNFYYFRELGYLRSDIRNIELYLSRIFCNMVDFSDEDIWKAKTVLYELFDNSLEHGSKFDKNKIIKVETLISNNGLHVIVSDQGEGFNISKVDLTFNHNKTTGRGIMMIKTLSDIFSIKDSGRTAGVFISREKSQYIPFIV